MSNPVINRLDEYQHLEGDSNKVMTVSGTLTSFLLLSVLVLLPAAITWNWAALGYMDRVSMMAWTGSIAGFILALIITFVPKTAPYLAPLYAVMEGMLVGGLSAILEMSLPGIVVQAVFATMTVIFTMYLLFKTKVITVTERLRSVVITATGAIALMYIINLVLVLLGNVTLSRFLWSSHPLSIAISVLICLVAAYNLLLDFDNIEVFSKMNAPKYMDWYCAFGLMVTVIWLYIEIMRLLSKFLRR